MILSLILSLTQKNVISKKCKIIVFIYIDIRLYVINIIVQRKATIYNLCYKLHYIFAKPFKILRILHMCNIGDIIGDFLLPSY